MHPYSDVAFTEAALGPQVRLNSRLALPPHPAPAHADGAEPRQSLDAEARAYGSADCSYLTSVSRSEWPYLRLRGGPPGSVRTLDEHTLGWADLDGNGQHVSAGNLAVGDPRGAVAMDYLHRARLKVFRRATFTDVRRDRTRPSEFVVPRYDATVERAVAVSAMTYSRSRPHHVTARYSLSELAALRGGTEPSKGRATEAERRE